MRKGVWQRCREAAIAIAASAFTAGLPSVSLAQGTDDSMYGTHAVVFQPVTRAGDLIGCTFVYRVVQADHAYRKGEAVVAVGNISLNRFGASIVLGLKIKVRDINDPSAKYTRPHFAYLKTESASTAKSRVEAMDSEDDFRLFAIRYDEVAIRLIFEMLESGTVTIGFNRTPTGIDVLMPLDVRVHDAEPIPPQTFRRKRSNDAIAGFLNCYERLLNESVSAEPKK